MSPAAHARAVLLAFALASIAPEVAAQPSAGGYSPPFQLAYEAPRDRCPDAPAFLAAIHARTERARLATPDEKETAVAITVRIATPPGGPVAGRLEIHEPDGARQERAVESATCEEVAKALALVVALYLDPDATTAPEPPTPAPQPPSPTPASVSPPPPRRHEASAETRRAAALELGAGAGGGIAGGIGPAAAPLGRAFVEATIDGARTDGALPPWMRPSVRVSLDVGTSTGEVAAGSQRYLLLAGALRLCPVDLALGRGAHLGPCGALQAGVHRGTSGGVPNARAQDKPWVAPSATLHASLALAEAVTVELEGGVVVPSIRTRFFLAPSTTLWRTPAVAPTGSAAVTLWFR